MQIDALVLTAVPASITATALIVQQWLTARREKARVAADREAVDNRLRRDVARAAHVEASVATADMWRHLHAALDYKRQHLPVETHGAAIDSFAVPPGLWEAMESTAEKVLLCCSSESGDKLLGLHDALATMGVDLDSGESTSEDLDARLDQIAAARREYIRVARDELGLT